MADTNVLLTAFRFEVRLLRSPDVVAGRQNLPGAGEGYSPPTGAAELGTGGFQECAGHARFVDRAVSPSMRI